MRILAINAYHGGSHRDFLQQWISHSCHEFTVLSLPPRHWKWRMQHAALTLAAEVEQRSAEGAHWDVLFVTDMFDLTTFLGLVRAEIADLPRIVYFHENQWTYPVPADEPRDLTYGFINLKTAISADALWFNSDFHRREFFQGSTAFLKRMPDYAPLELLEPLQRKSAVHSPGIQTVEQGSRERGTRPLQLLWVARWEYDKNPEQFCAAVSQLDAKGVDFRLSLLGQSTPEVPDCFLKLQSDYADRIDHWGFLEQRSDYQQALQDADVVISTARHEFFGISILEAVAAGCLPVLPQRLSYPEIFAETPECFYDGSTEALVKKVMQFSQLLQTDRGAESLCERLKKICSRYHWESTAHMLDEGVTECLRHPVVE
ncbi:GDP-mannose-dependent alpha-(1-6)-phosphatidylinositol dimannoside mannosyltransferase [Gimesia panareensis]|uniref:tRNA-queuosine alpha-mannosyltransferase n=1 Tax=Gimesia panareensis TaxID=2527978 RepID=A0A518FV23_9PLAN|nr:DUF3524 domain-containing protein [Gimesia panareensis]QDV20191.1 GDP-mannose-dependent alpha-(1-6)-phosphatidylinositol dimannoside mannosyltransferase [Gimesia panareensis]